MTKVFEPCNIILSENKFDLAISGDGMFTMRSPCPLDDKRQNVKKNIYYTRNGKFTYDENNGYIVDQYGGILQVVSFFGHTYDASIKEILRKPRAPYEFPFNEPLLEGLKLESTGRLSYSDPWRQPPMRYTVWERIKLAQALVAPKPAKLIDGNVLENCWTGEELKIKGWVIPSIKAFRIEKLKPHKEYDLAPVITPSSGWNLNLWRSCMKPRLDIIDTKDQIDTNNAQNTDCIKVNLNF